METLPANFLYQGGIRYGDKYSPLNGLNC